MKIKTIQQIEITSVCNLSCTYCVHAKMKRPKKHMDKETYIRALDVAAEMLKRNGSSRPEVNLAGIGESTTHPDFCEYMILARQKIGNLANLIIATNGISLNDDHARALKDARVHTWCSLHRPDRSGKAVELLKKYGVLRGISIDPSVKSIDWAGQVKWHVSAPRTHCEWLSRGMGFVFSDGRVGTCCLDSSGDDGVIGSIHDDSIYNADIKQYSLCKSCHMTALPEPKSSYNWVTYTRRRI